MARRPASSTAHSGVDALLDAALAAAAGPAIVLDAQLRVRLATESAATLLGTPVPHGVAAPALLCGDKPERPVAEALAAGRPVHALVPRLGGNGETLVRIRSVPLGEGKPIGWLLMLQDAGDIGGERAVQFHGMWTRDPAMKHMFRVLERVAASDATVLVRGETGTGKELVAKAIHALSDRARGPLRALNCAALPANLLESELFGHAKGAFTGAVRDTPGHIVLADGGTLFLDEVAELPLELQAKLLRVLETRTVIPVGAREPIAVDVRVVAATHRALRQEVEAGRFRADLMYRLRVIPVFLPALRERRGDIELLLERFVEDANRRGKRRIDRIAPAALATLEHYDWPGNVRELRNIVEYVFAIGQGPELVPSDLPPELLEPELGEHAAMVAPPAVVRPASTTPEPSPEARRIAAALTRASGNREQAAKLLGLSRVTLWRRMKALGLG
ncbi:MAG: sigma 54-interacting transcriptional regulator [Nannocystaceae bacterium]|nr:sigma 54-interacting transcriptional regulator [Nannocystaceae bacterium]